MADNCVNCGEPLSPRGGSRSGTVFHAGGAYQCGPYDTEGISTSGATASRTTSVRAREIEEAFSDEFASCAQCGEDIALNDEDEWYSPFPGGSIEDAYDGGEGRQFWCGGAMSNGLHVPSSGLSRRKATMEAVEAEMKAKLLALRATLGGVS